MHQIAAIVGDTKTIANIAERACSDPLALRLEGWSVVGIGQRQRLALRTPADVDTPLEGFEHLGMELLTVLEELSADQPVLYLETEYFGGVGRQAAAFFRPDGMLWAQRHNHVETRTGFRSGGQVAALEQRLDWPINRGLRDLGVEASPGLDEFDTLGLGEVRSMRHLGAID